MGAAYARAITLALEPVTASVVIPPHMIQNGEVEVLREEDADEVGRRLLARLKTWVAQSRDDYADVVFRRPTTWWQHFKQTYADRWFMRWFVRLWPVREHVELTRVRAKELLPDVEVDPEFIRQGYRRIQVIGQFTMTHEE